MASIRITPALLTEIAARHDGVADEIAAARSAGADILAAVATHGPIMHQFKAAVTDAVARRADAFAGHEAAHRAAADKLRSAAAQFEAQEEANVAAVRFE